MPSSFARRRPRWSLTVALATASAATACGAGGAATPPSATSAAPHPEPSAQPPDAPAKPLPHADEPRPCEPVSSQRQVAGPPHPAAVCGNGVIDTIWGDCTETCAGGCGDPIQCRVECASATGTCDGAAAVDSCQSQGYAGGMMRCTADCELDPSGCLAAAPGAAVRQGVAAIAGDHAFAISDGARAAVFTVDAASTGVTGVTVDPTLRAKALRRLPTRTMAVGAIGDRFGFVTDDRRFGTIDLAGAVTLHGDVGDAMSRALILPEVGRSGSAAVLLGDYQRRVLTVFDPARRTPAAPIRTFGLDNLRVVVVDGAHPLAVAAGTRGQRLVVLRWNETWAFTDVGDHLEPLAAVPTGFSFTDTPDAIEDVYAWPGGGRRVRYPRSWSLYAKPPGGLSQAAVAGSSVVAAFGGTLVAHADGHGAKRRVQLFWIPIADPLAATVSAP